MFSEKEAVRRKVLHIRKGLEPETVKSKSKSATGLLMAIPEFAASRFILFYAALKGEVQTSGAVEESLASGKRVALPKVGHNALRVFEIRSYGDTREGAFNIPEPEEEKSVEADPERLDLIIVPGVAFDEKGSRLGFGRGYYDRFLKSISRKPPLVGLAFEFQMVEEAASTENDVPMDFVVTEKRIINCRQNRKGARK